MKFIKFKVHDYLLVYLNLSEIKMIKKYGVDYEFFLFDGKMYKAKDDCGGFSEFFDNEELLYVLNAELE
jgi:hypothetical protein